MPVARARAIQSSHQRIGLAVFDRADCVGVYLNPRRL